MDIHAAIKAGKKNDITVSPSHPTTTNESKTDTTQTNTTMPNNETTQPLKAQPTTSPAKPEVKVVDISIAGTPHRITCPSDEVQNLEIATNYLNSKIREIRQGIKGKSPNNEELLVLTCLELYDQVQTLKNLHRQQAIDNERARAMVEKIIKDARSVL